MDIHARNQFNSGFTEEKYQNLKSGFFKEFHIEIPFRIAETPVFLTHEFKNLLVKAGEEVLETLFQKELLDYSLKAIPPACFVPGEMGNPNFLALDFGICADENGNPFPQLIEFQGFPSLFAFQSQLGKAYSKIFQIDPSWTPYFNGLTEKTYSEELKKSILGKFSPQEVILLELDPWNQATSIDFAITQKLTGIKTVDLRNIVMEKNSLYYFSEGIKTPVKRIYNRVIFDELSRKGFNPEYNLTQEAEVEWAVHPNWFFRFSKFLLPKMVSRFIPPSHYLNEWKDYPENLDQYVLKPLFSFSGEGVLFHIKKQDLDQIKDKENYILQKKVSYLPLIASPEGGVKAEIRLLYLWDNQRQKPKLMTNLCRLSRGDMIGVKFNKEKTWVGGSIALFK